LFQESDADAAEPRRELHPLLFVLLGAVGGTFITGDLFNLYVWFEVMLLSALGLFALGGEGRNLDATAKYFVLNAVGTIFFLISIGLIYASTGHLNFTALARASELEGAARWLPFVSLLIVAFLVKAGAFPVFAWLPASYPVLPAPVLALFAGLLTKVGVYAVLRMRYDVFSEMPGLVSEALGWVASASMIIGALGAIYHWDMRRILAFHIVSQVGYMLFGVAIGTNGASVATLYYVLHHILAKSNLYLVAAVVARLTGSYDLRRCGGLYTTHPGLSLVFLVSALSMVGVPPLSGFWAKLMLLREGVAEGRYTWTFAALVAGFLTLYSMMKIWFEAFLKARPHERVEPRGAPRLGPAYVAIVGFAALTVLLGIAPEPVIRYLESGAVSVPPTQAVAWVLEGSR
jgi:multicomponent Na+:H+ antiporter subunit D